ncbi:MSC_0620 family F1-like ATPase-associated subunit [Ureaplasma zalophigenitalium]|uniref:Uncharacterized protein n=1 Tax=Ureaplasma zalophigenitalium TaxID=907723 RepID=A0ABT3BPB4_9BACT|nr:hypothetical protein [Ureaplasma zalophigenitalium]MCV3754100.1 hypothetical protein [Ureaplasma zalophigenitalium]
MSRIKKKIWMFLGTLTPLVSLSMVMLNNDQQPKDKPENKPKTDKEIKALQKLLQEQTDIHLKSLIDALLKIADDQLLELEKQSYDNEENKAKYETLELFNKYKIQRRFYLFKVKEFFTTNKEAILKKPHAFGFVINAPHVIADNVYFQNGNINFLNENYPNSFWGNTVESGYGSETNPYFVYTKESDPQKIRQVLNEYDEEKLKTFVTTYYNDLYNRARTIFFNNDDNPVMDKDFKIINDPNSSGFIASNPLIDDPFIETWDQWITKKITSRFSVFDLEENAKIIEPQEDEKKEEKPEKPDDPDQPNTDNNITDPPISNDSEIKDIVSDKNNVIEPKDTQFINELKKIDILINPELTPDKYVQFISQFPELKQAQKLQDYFLVNYPLNDFIEYRIENVRLNDQNEIIATVSVWNNIKKQQLAFDNKHKTYDIVIWNTNKKNIQKYLSKQNVFDPQLNRQYYQLIYYTNAQMSDYFFKQKKPNPLVHPISDWFTYQKDFKNIIIDNQNDQEKVKIIEQQNLIKRERINLNILSTYYYRMVNLPSFYNKYLKIIQTYYRNENLTPDIIQQACAKSVDLLLDYFKSIRLQAKNNKKEDNLMHESINLFQQTYNFPFSLKNSKYQNDLKTIYLKITQQVKQFYSQARYLSLSTNIENVSWFNQIDQLLQKAKKTLLAVNQINQTLRLHEADPSTYEKYAEDALSQLQALWKQNQEPNYVALYVAIPITILMIILITTSSFLYIRHKKTLLKNRGVKKYDK